MVPQLSREGRSWCRVLDEPSPDPRHVQRQEERWFRPVHSAVHEVGCLEKSLDETRERQESGPAGHRLQAGHGEKAVIFQGRQRALLFHGWAGRWSFACHEV